MKEFTGHVFEFTLCVGALTMSTLCIAFTYFWIKQMINDHKSENKK